MHIYRFLHIILFVAVFVNCQAQIPDDHTPLPDNAKPKSPLPYSTMYKTNPLPIIWGPIPLTAEYRLVNEFVFGHKASVMIGLSYLGKSPVLSAIESASQVGNNNGFTPQSITVHGIRAQGAYKFFFIPMNYSPLGIYIAPHASYSFASFSTDYLNLYNIAIDATHVNANILFGYQTTSDFFVYDFFVGVGYKKNTWIEKNPTTNTYKELDEADFYAIPDPLKLTMGLNVGIIF